MRDGVLHGRPTSARSSLGIGIDGLLRIARIGFFGTWAIGEAKRQALDQLNRPLAKGEVGIFTSAWGERTPTASNAVDVVVSGVPATKANVDLTGQIASVNDGGGTRIPEDGIVVQALGPPGKKLRADALPGSPFVAKLILKPWWEQVRDAVGGGPAIVRDGKISLPTTEDFSSGPAPPAPSAHGRGPAPRREDRARRRGRAAVVQRRREPARSRRGAATARRRDGHGVRRRRLDDDRLRR